MTEQVTDTGQIMQISVQDISPSPYQPRVHFDQDRLDELTASIKDKGVVQPITVRAISGRNKPYELVAGERRLRASIKAGLETIPSIVKVLTDQDAREITLIENLQREDLTVMEEARSVRALVEACDSNKAKAARAIGKQPSYVDTMLELLTLPGEVQNMIEAKIINVAQARVILEIEGEDKQVKGAKLAEKLNLTAAQLRGRMQKHINKKPNDKKASGPSGERKSTSFKQVSGALVTVYEALEGFDCQELTGDDKGLKARGMLRKQCALVRQSLSRMETSLLCDPPPTKKSVAGKGKPPVLSTVNA